jgi:hypothetical protein
VSIEGAKMVLRFARTGGGLRTSDGDALRGFTIAGSDRRFFWAETRIENDTVVAWSERVPRPAAVRYAFTDNTCAPGHGRKEKQYNLHNAHGLAASPFRTDDWSWDTPRLDERSLACRRCTTPPLIDGKPDDAAWHDADKAEGFRVLNTYREARYPTEVRFTFDDDFLFVATRCVDDKPEECVARAGDRDDKAIWKDDNVQVFLDANRDRLSYVRLVINPNGVMLDGDAYNESWSGRTHLELQLLSYGRFLNPQWNAYGIRVATGREPKAWIVETAIPWTALGREGPPDGPLEMGLYLSRTDGRSGERSEWVTLGRDFHSGAMMPYRHSDGCVLHHAVSRFVPLRFEGGEQRKQERE